MSNEFNLNVDKRGLTNKSGRKKMFNEADVKLLEVKDNFPFRLVEYVLEF